MKRLATLLFLCCATPLWADQPFVTEINDFSGGMDSQHLAEKIGLNQVRDNQNFRTDFNLGLSRRLGFKNETLGCSSFTAANGMWSFTDTSNNEWLIRLDSAGSLGGTNRQATSPCLTTAVSTGPISTASPTDADVGLGKVWFTNKVDGLMSWDGTTFVFYNTAPKASRIATYKNRVVLSDVSNEQSSLRLSGELNGADWNNDSRFSTSPLSIRIGGVNDGLKVVDFFPGIGEGIIFKALSMSRLLGNDQRDFRVEQITPEIGTIFPNTIAQKGQTTLFLSNRGLDAYSPPYNFVTIGNQIQNLLDPLARLTSLSKSLTLDSVSDWTAGASSPTEYITTYTIVGAIAPNNHTFIDSVDSDWSAGMSSAPGASVLSTTSVSGALIFYSTPQPWLDNYSFESYKAGSTTSPLRWNITASSNGASLPLTMMPNDAGCTVCAGSLVLRSTTAVAGHTYSAANSRIQLTIIDASDGITPLGVQWNASNVNTTITCCTNGVGGKFPLSLIGKLAYILLNVTAIDDNGTEVNSATVTSNTPVYLSTSVRVSTHMSNITNGKLQEVDLVQVSSRPSTDFYSWFKSQTFDTRVSSPIYDPFRASVNQIGQSSATATFGIQTATASDGCCWNAAINVSTTNPTITTNSARYFRYVSTFAVSNTSTVPATIQIDSVTLGAYVTGYLRTAMQDVGSDISSLGVFTANQDLSGDGAIQYELQAQTVPVFNESSWTVVSLNVVPSITAHQYIFARMSFSTKASTTIPFVDNITFNWTVGAGNPVPFASTWREGYYLFYSTNIVNTNKNDHIAVLNRNNMLDQFSGSTLAASTVYNNTLEMGDAFPTGGIYSMDKNNTDPSGNIRSSVTLRRLDGNGNPDALKIWDRAYFTLSRADTSQSQIYSVEYAIDGSTTFYSASNVELSTGVVMSSLRSDIPLDQVRQGQFLDLRFSELTQNTLPYTLNKVRVYGTILEVQ